MGEQARSGHGAFALAEMQEFASFAKGTQRYIRRSLDIGFRRDDAVRLWARDAEEMAAIRDQQKAYARIDAIRSAVPDDPGIEEGEDLIGRLVALSAFDLGEGRLPSFAAYRFLYERLLGAKARPWLPAAFCGAAALPPIRPCRRKTLLQSLSEAAATAPGWSDREPCFYPEKVEAEAA